MGPSSHPMAKIVVFQEVCTAPNLTRVFTLCATMICMPRRLETPADGSVMELLLIVGPNDGFRAGDSALTPPYANQDFDL